PVGEGLVVAVLDGAPNGSLVRLARVEDPTGGGKVTWGAEIPQTSDDSEVVSLSASDKTAVLAWDDWDAHARAEVVRAVAFPADDVRHASAPAVLSRAGEDAEGPLLARRPGGFWLAFVARDSKKGED